MHTYCYVARDSKGQRKQGTYQAASSTDVVSWLREQGLTATSVDETLSASAKRKARTKKIGRIKSADLAALCWQLATMLEGGVPITEAIASIQEDTQSPSLEAILTRVLEKIHHGETLSSSIEEYPKVFNTMTRSIIMSGETSGTLTISLQRIAEYFDTRDKLMKKVQMATAYPIFVLSFVVVIVTVLMTFIIPRFRAVFAQFHGDLPAFTKAFMGFYDILRFNAIYIIGFIILAVVVLTLLVKRTKGGHYAFSRFVLGVPLIGKIRSQAFVVALCRTMATLLSSGVSVLEVFDILSTMTKNDIIKNAIVKARQNIVEGSSVSMSMADAGFFPKVVIKMVDVGEKSGSISKVLDRTADYYERKVDTAIGTLMTMLEPIMIITVGSIVLVVAIAMYLPIFQMSDFK
jgi:type IV pilus assembly protein PilC